MFLLLLVIVIIIILIISHFIWPTVFNVDDQFDKNCAYMANPRQKAVSNKDSESNVQNSSYLHTSIINIYY